MSVTMEDPIDTVVRGIGDSELASALGMPIERMDFPAAKFEEWFVRYPHLSYTRAIRYFCATTLMKLGADSALLDVGGGEGDLYRILRGRTAAMTVVDYGQNHEAHIRPTDFVSMNILSFQTGGAFSHVYLGHTFEHFNRDDDVLFINWLSANLPADGLCCIEPLFVGRAYAEVYSEDALPMTSHDPQAHFVRTKASAFPGKATHGMGFARIYSPAALRSRILGPAAVAGLKVSLITCTMSGADLPDMQRYDFKRRNVNYPLRILALRRS